MTQRELRPVTFAVPVEAPGPLGWLLAVGPFVAAGCVAAGAWWLVRRRRRRASGAA